MKILVISGFLGAGKTTFIKELIRRTGKNIVVMENEFGSAALDSNAVSGSGIEVLEFMEGCVCCTMKDSFVNSVLTVLKVLSINLSITRNTAKNTAPTVFTGRESPLDNHFPNFINPEPAVKPM